MFTNHYNYDDDREISIRDSYSSQSKQSPHPPPGRNNNTHYQPNRPSTVPKNRIIRGKFKQQQRQQKQQNKKEIKEYDQQQYDDNEDNKINHLLDGYERMPRESLLASLIETKKKLISMETAVSALKAENQRWESEITKQQKRIDRLLDSSINKHGTSAADIRKELEKSTIVRQLKRQNQCLRNNLAEKDIDLERIKKSIKGSALMLLSTEKDEYYMECIRLKGIVEKLTEENRLWKQKLKKFGQEDEEIKREVVRLSSGFQSLLESAGVGVSNIAIETKASRHKKGNKGTQILNYFNSDTVVKDSGIPIGLHNTDNNATLEQDDEQQATVVTAKQDNVQNQVLSTPYSNDNRNKSKDIFDITPSTPFPLLDNHHHIAETPNIAQVSKNPSSISSTPNKNSNNGSSNNNKGSPKQIFEFKIGDRVQGQYKGGVNWYDATIKAASNKTGETYHLLYDDGDEEKVVPVNRIRPIQKDLTGTTEIQQQQQKNSPSKQDELFDKYLDEISDDGDNGDNNNKENNALSTKGQHNDNDYDDDFEP